MSEGEVVHNLEKEDLSTILAHGEGSEKEKRNSGVKLYPYDILPAFLEGQVFSPDPEFPDFSAEINIQNAKKAIQQVILGLQKQTIPEQENISDEIHIPENFGWEKVGQRATLHAVQAVYQLGLSSKEVLDNGLLFVGPGNLSIEKDGKIGQFSYGRHLDQHIASIGDDESNIEKFFDVEIPADKAQRNSNIDFIIGEGIAKSMASQIISAFTETGLSISTDQALYLAIASIAAHEYTHGIDKVLTAMDERTLFKRDEIESQSREDFRATSTIHSEHLARGVEDLVFEQLLKTKLSLSDDHRASIITKMTNRYHTVGRMLNNLVEQMGQKGLTLFQVIDGYSRLISANDPYVNEYLQTGWDLENFIAYYASPYNEEEVRYLLKYNKKEANV